MAAVRKLFMGLVLLIAAWVLAGLAVVAAAGPFTPAGRYVEVDGRRMRLVCAGPKGSNPIVWMEAGAFGLAADFAAIQDKLTAKGLRSCAYDRAGMGFSDPGPKPRDSAAIVADLEKLMAASGEPGPYILMAHSMAGLHVRLFAARNPDKLAGLVLIEAATPQMVGAARASRFLSRFTTIARVAAVSGTLGLTKPFYFAGDRIGLPPQGQKEKRRAYVSGRHARTSASEVLNWRRSSDQAAAAAPFDPRWPVSVILAGAPRDPSWTTSRRSPELASRAGWYEPVVAASHTTVLGETHGDAAVRGVAHVLANLPGADEAR